jgi:peptide/nickel transport system substrate-binding protein
MRMAGSGLRLVAMTPAKILGCACVLALGLSACGGGKHAAELANGGTYTEPISSDPGNLHPLRAQQVNANLVLSFAYDTLINLDANGRVVSQLAEKWQVTPKRVTFTLRRGVTCSDGAQLTAADVASNFEWVKDPKNKSTVIGEKLPSADFTVTADNAARTVTLTLKKPFGFLLQSAGLMWIVCPEGLENPQRLAHGTDGTGPFQLVDYVADDHVGMAVRKQYRWGPNGASTAVEGFPDRVVLKVVNSETTSANLLLSGQLNSVAVSGPDLARLKGHRFQESVQLSGPNDLFFNQRADHPGVDPAVRKALVMALDLDQLTKVATEGSGRRPPGLAILPPHPCRADSLKGGAVPGHDLEAAKALLDEAGWTAGSGGTRAKAGRRLQLTLIYPSGGSGIGAAMELVAQWWKQLGADVKLRGQGANAYTQTLFAGNRWDVAWLGVAIPLPSIFTAYATGPLPPGGQNFAAIHNPEYERLAAQALETTGAAGCDLWLKAEQVLFRNVDVVPVAAGVVVTFAKRARIGSGQNGTEPTSIRMLAD